MTWMNGLSREERQEVYEDRCAAYQQGIMSLQKFTIDLAKLGYNATDIAEAERFYRPSPPENEDT